MRVKAIENWSLCDGKCSNLSWVCSPNVVDPVMVTFYSTMTVNMVVYVTCICIWIVMFMNVSLQIFATAEATYHQTSSYTLHVIVTLAALPTVLLYWTFATWFMVSRLVEWMLLAWSTPCFSRSSKYQALSIDNKTIHPEYAVPTAGELEIVAISDPENPKEGSATNVGGSTGANNSVTELYTEAVALDSKAEEAENLQLDSVGPSAAAAESAEAKAKQLHQLVLEHANPTTADIDAIPTVKQVKELVERTKKRASRIRKSLRPPYPSTWSQLMLDSPFPTEIGQFPYRTCIIICIIVEIVTLGVAYNAGTLLGFQATILLTVLTGVLLMLWVILDAADNCSRAFWYQWCYFAGSAVLSAFLCLVRNDWSNQFVTTCVLVYVAVLFTLTGLLTLHEAWVLPLHEFWTSTSFGQAFYTPAMGIFWVGVLAFTAAALVYEFADDNAGVYCRVAYQLCWAVPALLIVGNTLVYPRDKEAAARRTGSAYGALQRGDWWFYFRLVAAGETCLLMGVFGGAWASGRDGVLSVLVFLAGITVLCTATVLVLGILLLLCRPQRLRQSGWSVQGVLALKGDLTFAFSEQVAALWAWDAFRVYALCVLVVILAVSVYTVLSSILLYLFLVVLHGYVLVEHHFFSPVSDTITIGGVVVARLHTPKRRLYMSLLVLLLFCDVLVMGVATWSLTTPYAPSSDVSVVRPQEFPSSPLPTAYAICSEETFYTLDAVDLAYMTELTYFRDPVDHGIDCGKGGPAALQTCLDNYFTPDYTKPSTSGAPYSWQVLDVVMPKDKRTWSQVAYYGARSDAANVIVVGIRGSTTGRDWLEDFNLYSEASLLQFFSLVVPMTYVWPYEATATMVKALSFTQRMLFASTPHTVASNAYYKPAQQYV